MKLTKEMVEVQGKSVVYRNSDSVSSLFDNTGIEKVLERHAPEIFVVEFKDYDEKVVFLSKNFLLDKDQKADFLGEYLGPGWGYHKFVVNQDKIWHTGRNGCEISAHYRCKITIRGVGEIFSEFEKIREGRTEIEYTVYFRTELDKPAWASDCGEDEFGSWAEFEFKGITQRLRWVPSGKFLMGSPKSEPGRYHDEGPQHEVTLTQGFWMFDTAITQALWEKVMGYNPSKFKGPDRPVEMVSWDDARKFIREVNGILPGLALSLPTEAQWEYACRAGTQTPFCFGDSITPEQANYNGNDPYNKGPKGVYREETVAVKSLPPNAWGLYEMHGNVWEWCEDYWSDDRSTYSASAETDPIGPSSGDSRVIRGGSWYCAAVIARAACRFLNAPGYRFSGLGFRCIQVQY